MRMSDWSSDVCSSDLIDAGARRRQRLRQGRLQIAAGGGFGAVKGEGAQRRPPEDEADEIHGDAADQAAQQGLEHMPSCPLNGREADGQTPERQYLSGKGAQSPLRESGSATCRERVCRYV